MSKPYNTALQSAHKRSSNQRDEVLTSEQCGCFQCCQNFRPDEIEDWTDEVAGTAMTALCPRCGVDSVIGSGAGFALTPEFLREMHKHWFT